MWLFVVTRLKKTTAWKSVFNFDPVISLITATGMMYLTHHVIFKYHNIEEYPEKIICSFSSTFLRRCNAYSIAEKSFPNSVKIT